MDGVVVPIFRLTLHSIHFSYDYHWMDGDQLSWTYKNEESTRT